MIDVICINLEKRIDRKNEILEQFNKESVPVNFFNAISGKELGLFNTNLRTNGMVGCYLSHYLVLKHIKEKYSDKEYVIIIEDDLKVCNNFYKYVEEFINDIPKDFDIGFFGYYRRKDCKLNQVSKSWLKLDHIWGAHFYMVNVKNIQKIINEISTIKRQIDLQIIESGRLGLLNLYCSIVPLGNQSGSITDVQTFKH